MRHCRANSPVPCMRSRFTRRRPAKGSTSSVKMQCLRALECRAGALGLGVLELRVTRHRDNTERGDAIALPPQHAEAEAVEGETLAALGDRACFMNDQTGDSGCLFIGQGPIHRA